MNFNAIRKVFLKFGIETGAVHPTSAARQEEKPAQKVREKPIPRRKTQGHT